MKKITLASVKSFVKKNANKLYIDVRSSFSGYTDGIESVNSGFTLAEIKPNVNYNYNLGIDGAWFVGSSRDYFQAWENETMAGIKVYNSCGSFILATKK